MTTMIRPGFGQGGCSCPGQAAPSLPPAHPGGMSPWIRPTPQAQPWVMQQSEQGPQQMPNYGNTLDRFANGISAPPPNLGLGSLMQQIQKGWNPSQPRSGQSPLMGLFG